MGAASEIISVPAGDCPPATARLPRGAYYALAVLTALNVINVWHRYLIANLSAVSVEDCDVCDDVAFVPLCFIEEESDSASEEDCLACRNSYNTEFYNLKDGACIDNSQYSTLAGVAFTMAFAVATLFAGRLTDTLDRRFLHTGAILVWSLAAAAHGTCESFECLMESRVILGIGEAVNAPACYALITLYFPHSRRATANGIYSMGTYLGSAVSSLCLALAVTLGWRNTAFVSGTVGVVVAAVLFFTVEHNPAMPPPVGPSYTKLPDDDPVPPTPPPLPPSEHCLSLPPLPAAAAAAGHKTVSFADKDVGFGVSGAPAASRAGFVVCGGGGGKRRSLSLLSMLPPSRTEVEVAAAAAGTVAVGSPSASSVLSSISDEHYSGAADTNIAGGRGGEPPGGAMGAGRSGGDFVTAAAAAAEAPAARVLAAPSLGQLSSSTLSPRPRFLVVDESPLQSRGGSARRNVGRISGGNGSGGGSGGVNPLAINSAGAGGDAVRGGERERRSRSGGVVATAAATSLSAASNYGAEERQREEESKEREPEPGEKKKWGEPEESKEGGASRENCSPSGSGSGRTRRKRKEVSGGGGGGVAPYSRALEAAGAATGGRNRSGWGWYDDDDDEDDHIAALDVGGLGRRGGAVGLGQADTLAAWRACVGMRLTAVLFDLLRALRVVVSNRVVLLLFAASSARMIATWAMAGYMAIYYHRQYPSQISMYSVLNAGFVSVGGMASSYFGGVLSDRLRVRNEGVLGYIPALGSLAAISPVAVVLFARSFYISICALFVTYLVGECWLGPGMACLQMEVPKEVAGTSVAILLFLNSVVCNLGTWYIGKMDDGLATVRNPFFAVLFVSYASSFLLFALLGLLVNRKHRRPSSTRSRASLHASGGAASGSKRGRAEFTAAAASSAGVCGCKTLGGFGSPFGDGIGGGGGGGRKWSVCEMVRRTFSRTGDTSEALTFGDIGVAFRGRDEYYDCGDESDQERVAFLTQRDDWQGRCACLVRGRQGFHR